MNRKPIVFTTIPTIKEREQKERMEKHFKQKSEEKKAKQREVLKFIDFLCDTDITTMSRYDNPYKR